MKKILAVAIASAFAAPAFAATANVDVYGSINLSVERVSDGDDSWMRMVTNNNSFIGFKGSEDLGGGMKAVWQIESNINVDGNESNKKDAGNIFGTRNTYVGLAGGFGTVIGGVHDTPYKMSTGPLDLFVGTLGDYNGVFGAAMGNPSTLFDLRTGNTIAYMSPNFSGFDFKAAYVMGGEGNDAGVDTSKAYSLSGTYSNGPLFVTAAYETHKDVGLAACNAGATCLGFDSLGGYDQKAWKIGAGYKFGDFKVGAVYEKQDDNADVIGHSSWMLNGAYTMGAITLKAEFIKAGDLDAFDDTGAKMYALGADYALSKRTTVQLTYAKMNNDTFGAWSLGQGPQVAPFAADENVSGFSMGVKHTF
ncbi:MAG: porin [Thiobacillus sp.]